LLLLTIPQTRFKHYRDRFPVRYSILRQSEVTSFCPSGCAEGNRKCEGARRCGNDGDGESVQPYSSNWLKVIDLQMIK
ncbi:MAG: hypothetical protein WCF07_13600, partial [Nitrososphaeraceae archaeon]